MKNISILLLLIFTLSACNSNQANNSNDTTNSSGGRKEHLNIAVLKHQIALQKGMENNDAPSDKVHFLDRKDIELSIAVIKEGLVQAGYKVPDKDEFRKKIKEIYNCENSDNSAWKGTAMEQTITPASWKSGVKFIDQYSNNYGETERKDYKMVAFGDNNFTFDLEFLSTLINIKPDNTYKIALPRNLIARNRYLFNGNKGDLDYLVKNDKDFLSTLVAVFGYDQVPEINGAALSQFDTGTSADEQIGSYVFDQYWKPGKLEIRKGLIKYILDHTTANNNNMIKGLSNYVFKFSDRQNYTKISFENKCEMVAYAGTLEYQLRNRHLGNGSALWDPYALLTNFKIHYPDFVDEIKKKNYYGDAEIKKAVGQAEEEAYQATLKPDPDN